MQSQWPAVTPFIIIKADKGLLVLWFQFPKRRLVIYLVRHPHKCFQSVLGRVLWESPEQEEPVTMTSLAVLVSSLEADLRSCQQKTVISVQKSNLSIHLNAQLHKKS